MCNRAVSLGHDTLGLLDSWDPYDVHLLQIGPWQHGQA